MSPESKLEWKKEEKEPLKLYFKYDNLLVEQKSLPLFIVFKANNTVQVTINYSLYQDKEKLNSLLVLMRKWFSNLTLISNKTLNSND